jgi:uncharacterized protein (DUF433 family)
VDTYVARNDAGTLTVVGSRVSLASIVYAWWRGETAESMVQAFPSLSLEQVHGAIAYYLRNRDAVDREIEGQEQCSEELRSEAEEATRELRERLLRARVRS